MVLSSAIAILIITAGTKKIDLIIFPIIIMFTIRHNSYGGLIHKKKVWS